MLFCLERWLKRAPFYAAPMESRKPDDQRTLQRNGWVSSSARARAARIAGPRLRPMIGRQTQRSGGVCATSLDRSAQA